MRPGPFLPSDRVPAARGGPESKLHAIARDRDDLPRGEWGVERPGGVVQPLLAVALTIILALVIAGWFLIGPPSAH